MTNIVDKELFNIWFTVSDFYSIWYLKRIGFYLSSIIKSPSSEKYLDFTLQRTNNGLYWNFAPILYNHFISGRRDKITQGHLGFLNKTVTYFIAFSTNSIVLVFHI
jgi:hypothetical protein